MRFLIRSGASLLHQASQHAHQVLHPVGQGLRQLRRQILRSPEGEIILGWQLPVLSLVLSQVQGQDAGGLGERLVLT